MRLTKEEFDAKIREQNSKWELKMEEHDSEISMLQEKSESWRATLRRASKFDYIKWLEDYLDRYNGGNVTHFYDYPLPTEQFFVATKDIVITPLYGANAINIIVPKGINVTGARGHNNVFSYNSEDLRFVPAYSNLF